MKSVDEIPLERRNIRAAIEDNIGSCVIALASCLCLVSAMTWPYIKMHTIFSEHLIDIASFNDYLVVNVFIFASYTLQYILMAGILEYTNPRGFQSTSITAEQQQQRKRQIRKELILGIGAMFGMYVNTERRNYARECRSLNSRSREIFVDWYVFVGMSLGNTTYAVTWMYFIEPYVWTTNYFVHHQYTLLWFIGNVIVYGLIFDSWFYWTHRALHESIYLWNNIHTTHHSFKTPSAFCQDAVHPLEGLVQGRGHTLERWRRSSPAYIA